MIRQGPGPQYRMHLGAGLAWSRLFQPWRLIGSFLMVEMKLSQAMSPRRRFWASTGSNNQLIECPAAWRI